MSLVSALTPEAFRKRIDRFIATRNPAQQGAIRLHHRRLYILPTRFGYLFSVMLLVLMLAAINYENSMAFALTFLLTAIGIVSLWATHRNLLNLEVTLKPPEPVFNGEKLSFNFILNNPNRNPHYAVGIQYRHYNPEYTAIEAVAQSNLSLQIPTIRRGVFQPAGFVLFTRYPTGLFHAWTWLRYQQPLLIYPQPVFDRQLSNSLIDDHSGKATVDMADGDDFAGLREYRNGESLRHISWKAFAQGRGMLSKTFQGHATPSLWINWNDMSAPSTEGKLSQMTGLVIQAHQQGRKFGLLLPDETIEQGLGASHQAHCLQCLARFQQSDPNSELPHNGK